MDTNRQHAIVIGGSMSGMLAARVLSDHYERVTLVERDQLPVQGSQLLRLDPVHPHQSVAPRRPVLGTRATPLEGTAP